MIDIEKFLISLRNNKNSDGLRYPIHLADSLQEEIKILQDAIQHSRREWVGLTDEEWAALWEDFAWESELTIEEQFQKEMTKKHGKGHYYMGAEEFWNRQKDVIQKLVNAKLKEKNI